MVSKFQPAAIPLPGWHTPATGFDQPFDMLAACHDRLRRSLDLLQRLAAHAADRGADAQSRNAAMDVLRYFDLAAPAHHEDEERHVIPLLQRSTEASAVAAAQRLLDDHASLREGWARLQPLLQAVAAGLMPEAAALSAATNAFVNLHREHLALEDEWAFPEAQRQLQTQGEDALAAMGEEMAGRRRSASSR